MSESEESYYFVKPLPEMHSVAEMIAHMTLWRSEAILKIQTGQGSKTDDCPENWPANEALKQKGWSAVWGQYEKSLENLVIELEKKDDRFLDELYYDTDFKGKFPYRFAIEGILHHDLYHLGQIALVMKLVKSD